MGLNPPCCHGDVPCHPHHWCFGFAIVSEALPTRPRDPLSCLLQIYRPGMTGRRAGTPIHSDKTHTLCLQTYTLMLKPKDTQTNSSHTLGPMDTEWLISVLKYNHKCLNTHIQTHLDRHKTITNISAYTHTQRWNVYYNTLWKDPRFGHASKIIYCNYGWNDPDLKQNLR